nr:response regulator transcription factor [Nonomuraea deserti]
MTRRGPRRLHRGPLGLASVAREQPDLVVLDVMLPGLDGFELLRRIRATSQVPVILLTARTEEVDRIIGFTAGSDDYGTKPFSARELALRARAILRRAEVPDQAAADRTLRFDGLLIDPDTRTVTVDADRTPELSALDFDLLVALAQVPGRVFTRRGLIEHVWGNDFFGDERVVDVHIRTLRRALGDDASTPRFVGTVRAIGYRFLARPAG